MREFFDAIRPMFGKMTPAQVNGVETILAGTEGLPITHRAYMLATALHETNRAMVPNVENLNYTTAKRIRAVWPSRFKTDAEAAPFVRNPKDLANKVYNGRMGNRPGTDDGWNFRGRGYPHLTGRDNYAKASRAFNVDLLGNPDAALHPEIAMRVFVAGMTEGWFTGKSLGDYLPGDYREARRVVNGLDAAGEIAGYARKFEAALRLLPKVVELPRPDMAQIETPQALPPEGGLWDLILALLRVIFGRK
jgi:putative chitinase